MAIYFRNILGTGAEGIWYIILKLNAMIKIKILTALFLHQYKVS